MAGSLWKLLLRRLAFGNPLSRQLAYCQCFKLCMGWLVLGNEFLLIQGG